MNDRERRVHSIELTLTPREVVLVWLRDAMQAGTIEAGARHSPPYRGAIANKVLHIVQTSMKGQPESLIEQAILQARREADLLYLLIVNANIAALEGWPRRRREYVFLLGYLTAEMNEKTTKNRVQTLRLAVLEFLKSVIMLDASIAQLVTERLSGQPVLFPDSAAKLAEQLQMATDLSTWFNMLAVAVGAAEIDLEELRNSLQSEIDRTVSIWVNQGRVGMLSLFGTVQEVHAAMDQVFLLCEPKSGEGNH
jgi:hypothetical protein